MTTDSKRNFLINIAFAAVIALGIYLILRFAAAYLFPFLIGVALAALTQKPARVLSDRLGIKSGVIAALMVMFIFIISVALIILVLFRLYAFFLGTLDSLKELLPRLGSALTDVSQRVSAFLESLQIDFLSADKGASFLSSFAENAAEKLTEAISTLAAKAVSRLPSFLFTLIVTVVASCYIAKDYEHIKEYIKGIVPEKMVNRYVEIRQVALDGVEKIVKGYFFMFLLTFVQLAIGFLVLGRENWLTLAFIVALVDILPVLGTGTVLIPWALAELLISNTGSAVGLLIIYMVVMVLRHVIEPKIIGREMGLHPLVCLGAMFVGLKSVGFWGLVLFPFSLMVLFRLIKSGKIKL